MGIATAEEDLTTTTARTAKGEHLVFGWVDGIGLENFKNTVRISEDLDIRTDGGQFVAPPSLHPSGRRYEWVRPPWEVPPRPVPAWLADFLREEEGRKKAAKRAEKLGKITSEANKQKAARLRDDGANPYGKAALEDELSTLRATSEGERNDRLNKAAFSLFGLCKGGVLGRGEVERELTRAARSVGLTDSEIEKTLRSAWSGATAREIPDDGPKATTSATGAAPFQLSDFGKWKRTEKKVKNPETGKTDTKIGFAFNFSRSKAADSIRDKMVLAMDSTAKDLYFFDGEIYKPQGVPKIADTLYGVCGDHINRYGVGEVLDRVKSNLQLKPVIWTPDPYIMPLANGVLELKTGAFRGYRSSDLLTFKYNARWEPEGGEWKEFVWFLCTSLPDPRDVLTVIDIMTAVALRVPFDVIVQLFGGGSNGKGILEKVMLALFTQERSTALELEELKKSRFGPGALFDVDLWIISEVEGVKDAVSALKKIATGEFTDSDTKYGGRRKGRPHAVPILDSNHAFDYGDDSYGRKRRIVRLDFCYTFGDGPGMRPIDRHLKEKLTRPEVLAGIVQIIAARAPGLIRDMKIYNRKTTDEAEAEYKRQQYSLSYFCEECLGNSPPSSGGGRLTVPAAREAYEEYCRLFKVPTPATKVALGKYISKVFGVTSSNTKIDGEDVRVYGGVYLTKSPSEAYADHVNQFYSDRSDSTATDKRQIDFSKTAMSSYTATEATDNILNSVLGEIERAYLYIGSCGGDEKLIHKESYHEKSVAAVASVAGGRSLPVSPATERKSSVAGSVASVAGERELAGDSEPSESEDDAPKTGKIDRPTPAAKTKGRRLDRLYDVLRYSKNYGILYQPDGKALEYSPWAVNVAKSCSHGCKYCYGPSVARKTKDQYRDVPDPKTDLIKRINAELTRALKDGCDIPRVHLTFSGDLYDPRAVEGSSEFSSSEEMTRAAIEAIHSHGVGVQILTKGREAARDFDLLGPRDRFGVSLTFLDPEKSREWEPNAALPDERIENLRGAKEKGLTTWASLEPVIDPEETLELIRRSAEYVDIFAVGKWNHDKLADKIDWHKFASDVVELLESLGATYYVKDDLKRYLPSERDRTKSDPPEEDRLPTAEEAVVLEGLAGRILENWPGLPEMVLWEKARGKLGSRLPLGVVRSWLSESGYTATGEKYGGGVIWNLPTSEEAVA
jgi:DNA repair photolyase